MSTHIDDYDPDGELPEVVSDPFSRSEAGIPGQEHASPATILDESASTQSSSNIQGGSSDARSALTLDHADAVDTITENSGETNAHDKESGKNNGKSNKKTKKTTPEAKERSRQMNRRFMVIGAGAVAVVAVAAGAGYYLTEHNSSGVMVAASVLPPAPEHIQKQPITTGALPHKPSRSTVQAAAPASSSTPLLSDQLLSLNHRGTAATAPMTAIPETTKTAPVVAPSVSTSVLTASAKPVKTTHHKVASLQSAANLSATRIHKKPTSIVVTHAASSTSTAQTGVTITLKSLHRTVQKLSGKVQKIQTTVQHIETVLKTNPVRQKVYHPVYHPQVYHPPVYHPVYHPPVNNVMVRHWRVLGAGNHHAYIKTPWGNIGVVPGSVIHGVTINSIHGNVVETSNGDILGGH